MFIVFRGNGLVNIRHISFVLWYILMPLSIELTAIKGVPPRRS